MTAAHASQPTKPPASKKRRERVRVFCGGWMEGRVWAGAVVWPSSSAADASPRRLACCVHGPALHARPSHWGAVSRGHGLESRCDPWSTTDITFWGCRRPRQAHCFGTAVRSVPERCSAAFIFHVSMRCRRQPVCCASWQARSTGGSLHVPRRGLQPPSRAISPAHLARPSRLSHGNPRVSPGGSAPRVRGYLLGKGDDDAAAERLVSMPRAAAPQRPAVAPAACMGVLACDSGARAVV